MDIYLPEHEAFTRARETAKRIFLSHKGTTHNLQDTISHSILNCITASMTWLDEEMVERADEVFIQAFTVGCLLGHLAQKYPFRENQEAWEMILLNNGGENAIQGLLSIFLRCHRQFFGDTIPVNEFKAAIIEMISSSFMEGVQAQVIEDGETKLDPDQQNVSSDSRELILNYFIFPSPMEEVIEF